MDRPSATIKTVAIALGLAIVALTVVLVFAVVDRLGGDAPPRGVETAIALPAGARVEGLAGGEGLSLLLRLESGAQTVVTVDPVTGEVLGRLELLARSE